MKKDNDINPDASIAPIRIDYTANSITTSKNYELLVVACDPRNLKNVCNFDKIELEIFRRLQNFTFHTTLMTIPVLKAQTHGVIFAPYLLEKMQGSVIGFRNESAKKFGLDASNKMKENLVTVYQLLGPETNPYTPQQFTSILEKELPTLDWWPFGTQYKIKEMVTTPYFDHYSQPDLKQGWPWMFLSRQGLHQTLYVHASTCFESALDCWGYENILLENKSSRQALPGNKLARIAIIGAGVSGLLFAVKLKRLGYTNINILESTDRYGGKTHTIKMDGPYPAGSNEPTYCELGTCYMSPAYDPMINDLKEYLQGNEQIAFGDNVNRGIVTKDQLPSSFNAPLVMDSSKYYLRKAEAELNLKPGYFDDKEAQAYLLEALAKYIAIHFMIFEGASPMPSSPPKSFLDEHSSKTFVEFLRYHNLEAIIGILQYGYEVQGYGTLTTIPAFYGLVWITPPIIEAMIEDAFGGETPIVTAWSKGWGDLWTQIVTKEKLDITYNVTINAIKRI
jgi:hypothetical protein